MENAKALCGQRSTEWLRKDSLIAPSLMCADFLSLGEEVQALEAAGADAFHMDIMDGHFVDNLALNIDMVRQVRSITSLPIDVHLMVEHPESFAEKALTAGADLCIFHWEATRSPVRLLERIHDLGGAAGIAINPATPVDSLRALLPQVEMVLVMTVEPGFAGQKFVDFTLNKIAELKDLKQATNLDFAIGVDGAIGQQSAKNAARRGASFFVGGTSGVFLRDGTDFASAIQELRRSIQQSAQG